MDSTTNEVTLELVRSAACDYFYKGLQPNSFFVFRPGEVMFARMCLVGNLPTDFHYTVYI